VFDFSSIDRSLDSIASQVKDAEPRAGIPEAMQDITDAVKAEFVEAAQAVAQEFVDQLEAEQQRRRRGRRGRRGMTQEAPSSEKPLEVQVIVKPEPK
jgi:hypothetical protein